MALGPSTEEVEARRQYQREWYAKNNYGQKRATSKRNWNLMDKYGITSERYDELLSLQNGVCAICKLTPEEASLGRSKKYFDVDHDHSCCEGSKSCGECVRGLLCNACNKALGLLNDDIRRIREMEQYLSKGSWS